MRHSSPPVSFRYFPLPPEHANDRSRRSHPASRHLATSPISHDGNLRPFSPSRHGRRRQHVPLGAFSSLSTDRARFGTAIDATRPGDASDYGASWSPAGRMIAFVRSKARVSQIYTDHTRRRRSAAPHHDADTARAAHAGRMTETHRLLRDDRQDSTPDAHVDWKTLGICRRRPRPQASNPRHIDLIRFLAQRRRFHRYDSHHIWVMNADGSAAHALTSGTNGRKRISPGHPTTRRSHSFTLATRTSTNSITMSIPFRPAAARCIAWSAAPFTGLVALDPLRPPLYLLERS